MTCLLYTSDAADDMQCVDLGGRRIIKKKREYFIKNIYPNLKIESPLHQKIEGFVQPNTISLEIYKMAGIMPGPPLSEDTKIQKKRGMFNAGLKAKFYDNKKLVVCDDCWAINYSHKRAVSYTHLTLPTICSV